MRPLSDEPLTDISLEKTQSPFERLALRKGIAIDTTDIENSSLQSIKNAQVWFTAVFGNSPQLSLQSEVEFFAVCRCSVVNAFCATVTLPDYLPFSFVEDVCGRRGIEIESLPRELKDRQKISITVSFHALNVFVQEALPKDPVHIAALFESVGKMENIYAGLTKIFDLESLVGSTPGTINTISTREKAKALVHLALKSLARDEIKQAFEQIWSGTNNAINTVTSAKTRVSTLPIEGKILQDDFSTNFGSVGKSVRHMRIHQASMLCAIVRSFLFDAVDIKFRIFMKSVSFVKPPNGVNKWYRNEPILIAATSLMGNKKLFFKDALEIGWESCFSVQAIEDQIDLISMLIALLIFISCMVAAFTLPFGILYFLGAFIVPFIIACHMAKGSRPWAVVISKLKLKREMRKALALKNS